MSGETRDVIDQNSRTTLHSVQSFRFPTLQGLQGFLDPLLQLEPVAIQRSNALAVVGFGGRCFPPAANKRGLSA